MEFSQKDLEILEKEIRDGAHRHMAQGCPPNLKEAILYSLLAPGKRIRPRLSLACSRMIQLSQAAALPAALCTEFFHCSTLIHDDLPCMDDDDMRRGQPSNHKKFGEGLALLAGDALMLISFDVLSDTAPHVEAAYFQRALLRFLSIAGARGVMGGQAREYLLNPNSKLEDLQHMHAGKTGALFEAALNLPKDLAGINDNSPQGQAITAFGKAIGQGFQVADDIEDATQDTDRVREEITPTSVLYYQSAQEAGETVRQTMDRADEALEKQFGKAAQELLTISAEVKKRL